MTRLVVATGNPGKLKEMQAYLQGLDWQLQLKPEDLDVEETGETFAENARLKASQVARATGQWAIADDSGLEVAALGGAPGVYSARYGQAEGVHSDPGRVDYLLKNLGNNPDRRARFVCVIALARPDGSIALEAEGFCSGEILPAARGEGGFGYDPIFYVPELGLSFAEMTAQQKHEISHRGRAFELLLPQLQAIQA